MTAPRLKEKYTNEIVAKLEKDLALDNVNKVPRLEKIVVNMGVGAAAADHKLLDAAMGDLRIITPTSFDGRGNYTMGVTEQLIFSEIDYDKIDRTRGMDITFVTTAPDDDSAFALLDALGFPFKDKE